MARGRWKDCRPGSPCPICGKEKHCAVRDDGGVHCHHASHSGSGPLPAPAGFKLVDKPTKPGGFVYEATDAEGNVVGAVVKSPEQIAKEQAEKEKRKAEQIRRAHQCWADAKPCVVGDRVHAYLRARGIDVAKLPGGKMPSSIRYSPACFDFAKRVDGGRYDLVKGPAMVAVVVDHERAITGVHRTFLDPGGEPRKRDKALGEAKKMLGACDGRTVPVAAIGPERVMMLGEGIETTLAAVQATGFGARVCLDAGKLANVVVPDEWVQPGALRAILILVDLDAKGAGQKASGILANRLRREMAERGAGDVAIVLAEPCPGVCPTLTHVPNQGEHAGENRPGANAEAKCKGVDWDDVHLAVGDEVMGAWLKVLIDEATRDVPPAPPSAAEQDGTCASGDLGGEGGGGHEASRGESPFRWVGHDFGARRACIADGAIRRARQFLLEQHMAKRAATRFTLSRWGGKWFGFDGKQYVEVDDAQLFGEVGHWLDQFWRQRQLKQRVEFEPVNPTPRDVEDVMKFLASETIITAKTAPAWLPPHFDQGGDPLWGRSAVRWREGDLEDGRLGRAIDRLVLSNGVLDMKELRERRRVKIAPHDVRLFNFGACPYVIDPALLESVLAEDDVEETDAERAERDWAWLKKHCPTWHRYLWDATAREEKPHDHDRVQALQLILGELMAPDPSFPYIYLFIGPRGTGKTTLEKLVYLLLGTEAVGATSFASLSSKYGPAALVGKRVAMMGDAHVSQLTDATQAVEVLKTMSGGGFMQFEDKYGKPRTLRVNPRFVIFLNDEPQLKDNSAALARRLVVWNFTRSHTDSKTADPAMEEKLAREVSAIAVWALAGYARLWAMEKPEIATPQSALDIYNEIERSLSPMKAFSQDCLEFGPEFSVKQGDVIDVYTRYAKREGTVGIVAPKNVVKRIMAFTQGIRVVQPRDESDRRPRIVLGMRLRHDLDDELLGVKSYGSTGSLGQRDLPT